MNSYHVINYTAGADRLSSHRTHEEATKAAKLATAANIASGLHEPGEHDEIKVWSGTMRDLRVALAQQAAEASQRSRAIREAFANGYQGWAK